MRNTDLVVASRLRKILESAVFLTASFALTTCNVFEAGLGPKIDIAAPSVDVKSVSNGSYVSGKFTLTGTASDDVAVASVEVITTIDSTQVGDAMATYADGAWSLALDTAALSGGKEVQADLTIRATDTSKKTSDKRIVLYFDNIPPVIMNMTPTADNLASSDYALSEITVISGSTKESYPSLVTMTIGSLTYTDSSHPAAWSMKVDASQFYDVSTREAKNGSTKDASNGLYTAPYKIVATDLAGNQSTAIAGTLYINPDGAPIVDVSGQTPAISTSILYPNPAPSDASAFASWKANTVKPGQTIKFRVFDLDGLDTSSSGLYVALAPGSKQGDISVAPSGLANVSLYSLDSGLTMAALSKTTLSDGTTAIPQRADFSLTLPTTMPSGLGEYLLYIHASDYATNKLSGVSASRNVPSISKYISLFISNSDPAVTVSSPNDGAYLRSFAASGGITDDVGPAQVAVTIDNGASAYSTMTAKSSTESSWTFAPSSPLSEGKHTVSFLGKNKLGAQSSTVMTRSVTIDTTAPTVSVNAVSGYVSGVVGISGSANDAYGLSKVEYQLGGTSGSWSDASGTGTWNGSLDLSSASEGGTTLYARATDLAGNVSQVASATINVDRASPRATEVSHSASLIKTKDATTFTGIADDAAITAGRAAKSAILSYSLNGGSAVEVTTSSASNPLAWNSGTGAWSWTLPANAGDGLYTITLAVTDVAGKTASVTRTVQLDTTPPSLVVTSPVENESTSSSTYSIKGTAMDMGVGFDKTDDVEYSLNGGAWIPLALNGVNWSADLDLGSSEGAWKLQVRATDALGNQAASSSLDFYLDKNPPTLEESGVAGEANKAVATYSILTNTSYALSGTVSDTNTAGSPTLAIDGSSIAVSGTSWSLPVAIDTTGHTNDGSHTYTIIATDVAKKTTTLTRTVQVDTIAPSSQIKSAFYGATKSQAAYWLSGDVAAITGSSSDSGSGASGVTDVYYTVLAKGAAAPAFSKSSWNHAGGGAANWSGTLMLKSFGEGEFSLYVAAVDAAGNVESPVRGDFGVDQAYPTISESHAATFASNGPFSLSGQIGDSNALGTIAIVEYKNGSSSGTAISVSTQPNAVSGAMSADFSTQSLPYGAVSGQALTAGFDGQYTYVITITDAANKVTTLNRTVNIDLTSPNVNLSGIPAWVSATSYAIGGTASDPNDSASGIASISYSLDGGSSWKGATWADGSGGKNKSGSWTAALDGLEEKDYSLIMKAVDAAGNATTLEAKSFSVDVASPVLTMSPGTTSIIQSKDPLTFSGAATDDAHTASRKASSISLTYSKDGGTATTIDLAESGEKSGLSWNSSDGAWAWTLAAAADHSGDGLYSITVAAKDVAGKTTSATRTAQIDTTAPTLAVNSLNEGDSVSSPTPTITGTCVDYGVGLPSSDAVEYSFDSGAGAAWTAVSGGSSWTTNLSLGSTEGARTIYFRAKDKLGNTSAVITRNFYYDKSAPVLTEGGFAGEAKKTDISFSNSTNTAIVFSGTLSDSDALAASGYLQVSIDGATAVDIASLSSGYYSYKYTGTAPSIGWELDVAVGSSGLADGSHSFVFTGKDIAGKTAQLTRTVTVDTIAPRISVTTPESGTWLSVSAAKAYGSADDGSGTGVSNLYYLVDSSSVDHASDTWTQITSGANGWKQVSGSVTNWSVQLGSLSQGPWTLWLAAIDMAGNYGPENASVTFAKRSFGVDLENPTATEDALAGSSAASTSSVSLYRGDLYSLGGSAADTNQIASVSVTESANSGTAKTAAVSFSAAADGKSATWSTESLPLGASSGAVPEGKYAYTIVATDIAGRTTTMIRTVTIDKSAPTVTITAPASGLDSADPNSGYWHLGSAYTISGKAQDDGAGASGVSAIYYLVSALSDTTDYGSQTKSDIVNSGSAWKSVSASGDWSAALDISSSGIGEGKKKLFVHAMDAAGNLSLCATAEFGVDQSNPSLTESGVAGEANASAATYSIITKSGFTLKGKLSDSNALASSGAFQVSINGAAAVDASTLSASPYSYSLSGDEWSLAVAIGSGGLADGSYTYSFVAKDIAGKKTSISRSVTVDTTAPIITVTSPSAGSWLLNSDLSATGVASDGGGSGVVKVYLLVADRYSATSPSTDHSSEDPTDSAKGWSVAGGATSWTKALTLASEGKKTLWIKAVDALSNMTTAAGALAAKVDFGYDKTKPSLSFDAATLALPSTTNAAFAFSGSASDAESDLASLTVKEDSLSSTSLSVDGSAKWTYSSAATLLDGMHSYIFTATDEAGNVSTLSKTIVVDTKPPTISSISVNNLIDGSNVNGTIAISGTAADDQSLNRVELKIDGKNPDGSVYSETVTYNGSSAFSWNKSLDTTTLKDGSTVSLDATAYDAAGNAKSASTVVIIVNQDSDIPVVSFSNYDVSAAKPYLGEMTLKGSVSDDDGTVSAISATVGGSSVTATVSGNSFSIPMGSQGTKSVVLSVKDKAGKTFTFDAITKLKVMAGTVAIHQSSALPVIVDTEDPDVVIGTGQNQWMGTSFTLSGSAMDEFGIAGNDGTTASPVVAISGIGITTFTTAVNTTTGAWSTSVSPSAEGSGKSLTVSATDGNGRTRSVTFQYNYDKTAPTVGLTTDLSGWKKNATIALTGTYADSGGSGIKSVEYSVDGSTWTAATLGSLTWSANVTFAESATNKLYIKATDNAGNVSTEFTDFDGSTKIALATGKTEIKVDSHEPGLTETDVAAKATPKSYNANIVFKGTISDTGSGVNDLTLKYTKNGVAQTDIAGIQAAFGAGGYSFTVDASGHKTDGTYEFKLVATDVAGNSTLISYSIVVDTTGPEITINNPAADESSSTNSYTISGVAKDSGGVGFAGTTDIQYTLAGAFSDPTGSSNWTTMNSLASTSVWRADNVPLGDGEGELNLKIRAYDKLGNMGTAQVRFYYDKNPPSLAETKVATTDTKYTKSDLSFAGTASDTNALAKLEVAIDGGSASTALTLDPDTDVFKATAHGILNNELIQISGTTEPTLTAGGSLGPTTPYFVVNRTADSFQISSTAGGSPLLFDTAGVGLTTRRWTYAIPVSGDKWSYTQDVDTDGAGVGDLSGLAEGLHTLIFTATDIAGKTTSVTRTIYVDTTPPTASIGSPASAGTWQRGTITISGGSDDTGSRVAKVQIAITTAAPVDGDWKDATGTSPWTYTYDSSSYSDDRTIYVRAIDNAGNVTAPLTTLLMHLDQVAPTLSDLRFKVGSGTASTYTPGVTAYANGDFTISGSAADARALDSVTIEESSNGGAYATIATVSASPESWSWTKSSAGEGNFLYKVIAHDKAGNSSVASIYTVIVDKSNPTLGSIVAPLATDIFSGTTVTAMSTASDTGLAGVDTVEVKFATDSTWTRSDFNGTNWVATLNLGAEGQKTLEFRAVDKAGNVSSPGSSRSFWKDDLPPTGDFTAPNVNAYLNHAVTVSMTASDANGVASIAVSITDGIHTSSGSLATTASLPAASGSVWTNASAPLSIVGFSDTTCTITATIADAAGRKTVCTRAVNLDRTKPTVSFTAPLDSASTNKTISLSGTSSDNVAVQSLGLYLVKPLSVTGAKDTNLFTTSSKHNLQIGDAVGFSGSVGGVKAGTTYYVIADSLDDTHFKVSTTADDPKADSVVLTDAVSGVTIPAVALDLSTVFPVDGIYSWGISAFDTTRTSVIAASTLVGGTKYSVTLRAVATDGAGNRTLYNAAHPEYTDRSFYIDQDGDRPIISLSNISATGGSTIKLTNTVYGTVTDDDGVTTFAVGEGSFDDVAVTASASSNKIHKAGHGLAAGTAVYFNGSMPGGLTSNKRYYVISPGLGSDDFELGASPSDTTAIDITSDISSGLTMTAFFTITLEGASWSYDASSGDGSKTIYFKVIDAAGTTFSTGDATNKPKIKNGAGFVDSSVGFKVDTTPPDVSATVNVNTVDASPSSFTDHSVALVTGSTFGGPSTGKFLVQVLTQSANGVSSVTVSVKGSTTITYNANYVSTDSVTKYQYWVTSGQITGYDTNGAAIVDTSKPRVDVTGLSDATLALEITVTDGPGLSTKVSKSIVVDNTAPTISFLDPAIITSGKTDVVTGRALVVKGLANDNTGLASVGYKVGLDSGSKSWTAMSGSLFNWQLPSLDVNSLAGQPISSIDSNTFTASANHGLSDGDIVYFSAVSPGSMPSGVNCSTGYYVINSSSDPKKFQVSASSGGPTISVSGGSLVSFSKHSKDPNNDGVWDLPILVQATDKAGNVTTTGMADYVLEVDPSGDKPKVAILYPTDPSQPLGGTIRMNGSATDNNAVFAVFMEIDANRDGIYNAADAITGNSNSAANVDWYAGGLGHQVTGQNNWSVAINQGGEFNPITVNAADIKSGVSYVIKTAGTDYASRFGASSNEIGARFTASKDGSSSDGTGTVMADTIKVRVRAMDTKDGVIGDIYGSWQETTIIVSTTVPKIGETVPLQIDHSDGFIMSGKSGTASDYTAGMYLRNTLSVGDDTWYLKGSVEDLSGVATITLDGTSIACSLSANPSYFQTITNGYAFKIPIIVHQGEVRTVSSNLTAINAASPSATSVYQIRINIDSTPPTSDPSGYQGIKPIVQSNNGYHLYGTASDGTGSGVKKIEIYLLRRDLGNASATTGKYYKPNPDYYNGQFNDTTACPVSAKGTLATKTFSNGATDAYPTDSSYLITINESSTVMVRSSASPGTIINGDTGDAGRYYVKNCAPGLSSSYNWSLDIDSQSIPDGPIEIHYVIYDQADNSSHYKVVTSVRNNGPLLNAFTIGSDLNLNGTLTDSGEQKSFSVTNPSLADTTVDASSFLVKEAPMSIDVAVTQGNGALLYDLYSGTTLVTSGTLRASASSGINQILLHSSELALVSPNPNTTNGTVTLKFVIWDSTEETAPGSTSLSTDQYVTCSMQLVDSTPPQTVLSPFYWNSSSDNSLYGCSVTNGHIELASAYPAGSPDGNQDLSGQVTVRGTSYDNQIIKNIYMEMDNFPLSGGGTTTTASFGGKTYYLVASYGTGSFVTYGSWTSYGWSFTVDSSTFDMSGHRVAWHLDLDTAKVINGASAGLNIGVVVLDKAPTPNQSSLSSAATAISGAASSSSTTTALQSSSLVGLGNVWAGMDVSVNNGTNSTRTVISAYDSTNGILTLRDPVGGSGYTYSIRAAQNQTTVDVVPYVTGISLQTPFASRLNTTAVNLSANYSSANGYYPMYQGMTGITVNGFNLPYASSGTIGASDSVAVGGTNYSASSTTDGSVAAINSSTTTRTSIGVTIYRSQASGAVVIKTNGVASINNCDNNTASYNTVSEGGAYNADDRYIYIDDQNPTIAVAPFGKKFPSQAFDDSLNGVKALTAVSDYTENVPYSGTDKTIKTNWLGHVEYLSDSILADSYANLSGQVIFKGKAMDNQRIAKITVTVNNGAETTIYNSGTWSNGGSVDGADNKLSDSSRVPYGHVLNWNYAYDTSALTTAGASTSVPFVFKVYNANFMALSASSTIYADIVPYVTKVTTALSSGYSSNPSALSRSSSGVYPVRSGNPTTSTGETVTLTGFNFGTLPTVTLGGVTVASLSSAMNSMSFSVPASPASGELVINVNGLRSANNCSSRPISGTGATRSATTTLTSTALVGLPAAMVPNGTTIYLGDANKTTTTTTAFNSVTGTVTFATAVPTGNTSFMIFPAPTRAAETWNQSPNSLNNNVLKDDLYFSVWNFNTLVSSSSIRYPRMRVSNDGTTVGYSYDRGGMETFVNVGGAETKIDGSYTQWYDTAFAFDASKQWYAIADNGDATSVSYANIGFYAVYQSDRIGNSSQYNGTYATGNNKKLFESNYDNTTYDPTRVQEPKLATNGSAGSSSTAKVFMTYYDECQNVLKYRYATVRGSGSVTISGNINDWSANGTATNSAADFLTVASGSTAFKVGTYSAVGCSSDGSVAYVAWYDAANRQLVFSYNTSPTLTTSSGQWQTNAKAIDSGACWYVDMAVDANNGIHLAYYAADNGDLKYAYIAPFTTTSGPCSSTPAVVTVDSWLSVGSRTSISVKAKTIEGVTYYVPHISYFAGAFTSSKYSNRVAWRSDSDMLLGQGSPSNGALSDLFTGAWESMTVPTPNIAKDFTVGVGIVGGKPVLGYATTSGLEQAAMQ
jgi:hypothetical protein